MVEPKRADWCELGFKLSHCSGEQIIVAQYEPYFGYETDSPQPSKPPKPEPYPCFEISWNSDTDRWRHDRVDNCTSTDFNGIWKALQSYKDKILNSIRRE